MRALSVITLLTALVLPSGRAHASLPSDISTADLQTMQTQAAQGDAKAQNNLGLLYGNGEGGPQDYAKARQWYEKAAAQGNPNAQNNLGYLYVDGKGVPKDEKIGVDWIRKAAEQGDANGQDSLGEMYRDGRGVPQDDVLAYMWYSLAIAHSMGTAQRSTIQNRDKITGRMTPVQIAEAQKLAREWKPKDK
jgi:uncharacterized protein